MSDFWQPGDSVVLRNCGFFVGEVWGTPHIVIEDTSERTVLFRPEGTPWRIWQIDHGTFRDPQATRMNVLRLMFPGALYAVELYFEGAGEPYSDFAHLTGRFRGWKLNIEAAYRRTRHGFDTTDDVLDIFVEPDGTWHWADEVELDFWVRPGAYSDDNRTRFYDAAESAEKLIAVAQPPFDDEWVDWRPPVDLTPPSLPLGWELEPGWDVALSSGRRYDEWRAGHDSGGIATVVQSWRSLISANRSDPAKRRFRSGLRRKA